MNLFIRFLALNFWAVLCEGDPRQTPQSFANMLLALNPVRPHKTQVAKATNQQLRRQPHKMTATMAPVTNDLKNMDMFVVPESEPVAKTERPSRREGHTLVIGLNHETAPVSVREVLAVPKEEWNAVSAHLRTFDSVDEAAVLSTCNRFELYVVVSDPVQAEQDIMDFLVARSKIEEEELRKYLFIHQDSEAMLHIYRVACGLDSLVMGENQILSQVKACMQHAMAPEGGEFGPAGSAGRVLSRLLNQAVSAGKHVRFAYKLSEGGVSVSSAAVQLAEMKANEKWNRILPDTYVAIVGAGEMSRLLLVHLQAAGVNQVTLFNRSPESAQKLAEQYPDMEIDIHLMDEFYPMLGDFDIVFTSTSSAVPIVTKEELEARDIGVDEPLMLIDISMPSNVEASCGSLEGVQAYNVDNLKEVVEANTAARRERAEKAEGYIREQLHLMDQWMKSLPYTLLIKKLTDKYEHAMRTSLESSMEGLTDEQQAVVDKAGKDAVFNLLATTAKNIRRPDVQEKVPVEQLEMLFGLDS